MGYYLIKHYIPLSNAKKASDVCQLNGSTLHVYKQNELFSILLGIRNHKIDSYRYNEEKIHIGAVTVGGVTSGGVYKTGGDFSAKSSFSGRYELVYVDAENFFSIKERRIETIVLSKELVDKAKTSSIKEYVKDDRIEIVENFKPASVYSQPIAASLHSNQNVAAALSLQKMKDAEVFPTIEKCNAILNWLCDK